MGLVAVPPPPALGPLLRLSRKNVRLTLQQVSDHCRDQGDRIPISTLTRIESGKLDPGIRRLHMLLQLYRVPLHLLDAMVELEELAIDPPPTDDLERLLSEGTEHWKSGRIAEGLACLMAVRQHVPPNPDSAPLRQIATLKFAAAARDLGRLQLARHIVDEVMQEMPEDSILVRALVLASGIWRLLGSPVVALALIAQASERLQDPNASEAAIVYHQQAKLLIENGQADKARSYLDRAVKIYRQSDSKYNEARAKVLKVSLVEKLDGARKAIPAARSAIRFAEKHDFGRVVATAQIQLARLQIADGSAKDAVDALRRTLSAAVLLDDQNTAFLAHFYLWKCCEIMGNRERAKFEFQSAANYVRHLDESSIEADEIRRLTEQRRPS